MTVRQLAEAARAALGRPVTRTERLAGGSRKGVYRLTLDDASTAIGYLWADAENYWPAAPFDGDRADPFSPGVGRDLFEAANARLAALGLRVPEIHLAEGDIAIVEDFPGEDLFDLYARDPAAAEPVMARLAEGLEAMRQHHGPAFGKVGLIDAGGRSRAPSVEAAVLEFALRSLADAAARDQRAADARGRLEDRVHELAAAVQPRSELSVVHGELWGHVLIDARGRPVVIDIEDLMYLDAEWEHVFLRIRMGDGYHRLAVPGLDPDRMAFYLLAQRLSLTAGPLRLLEGDYPHRDFMTGIADRNLRHALASLE